MKIKFAVYESCVGESHYIGRYYRPKGCDSFLYGNIQFYNN